MTKLTQTSGLDALLEFIAHEFGSQLHPSTPRRKAALRRSADSTELLEIRQLLTNVGGGYLDHGLDAIYYSDGNFTNAAFTRKDVRLEFDWGSSVKPGGSISAGYSDVGVDQYSIRWTGQLMPRFSETYTFSGHADETMKLEIKPTGSLVWTTVVNQTSLQTSFTGSYSMQAGQAYDVRISYTEQTGAAAIQLRWSSPSTPIETIDTISQSGINNPDGTAAFTDIVKGARNRWESSGGVPVTVDAQGWPTSSSVFYYFQESMNQGLDVDPLMLGTIQFQFNGRANVDVFGNVDRSSLYSSYDSTTNLTTGSFVTRNAGANASRIVFGNATRNGVTGGPAGFTNLKMLRPTSPGSVTTYSPDKVFTDQIKEAMSHFEVIRHQYVANQQKEWSDRTLPGFFNQHGGTITAPSYSYPWAADSKNGWSWEYKILLSNETGRDLMISLPPIASGRTAADTSSYLVKLANLIRYGSDGVEPYSSTQVNPVYPPLNSNLRVYLELGNELWNFQGVFYNDYANIDMLTLDAIAANNEDFQAINFDNLSISKDANGNYASLSEWRYRMIMLRTVQISNIFRSVFGDAAMPMTSTEPRIRPLYEWQYDNKNNTAMKALTWADRYFNKTDPASTWTGTAQPVRYFLYGGGGAAYYGAVNGNGLTDLLPNSSFDATITSDGYTANPAGTGWVFSGNAGIARDTGPSDDIPSPFNGQQLGYLTDQSSMTTTFVVPATQTSDIYGVSFKAHNRMQAGATVADRQNLRVYLDYGTANQQDITARTYSQGNGYTPPAFSQIAPWKARNVFWTESHYYYTKSFSLPAGSTHTITIVGQGDIKNVQNLNQTAFLEDVRITSVDAIFAGGIPGGGEATRQPAGSNIINTMQVSVSWAKAFGLEHVAYESGWSLGGDDHGSVVQLKAKYGDPRTAIAQKQFMDFYHQAGGDVNVFGTYEQWSNWRDSYAEQGLLNVAAYPIINGIDNQAGQLKAEAISGITVPAVLDRTGIKLAYQASATTGTVSGTGGWVTWNIIVPNTGQYVVTVEATGSGSFSLLANDAQIASGTTGTLTSTVQLVKGLTVLKVRSTSGAIAINKIIVETENAPQFPIIETLSENNGSVSLSWSSVNGATGYVVRYGSSTAEMNQRVNAGDSLTQTFSGLPSGATVYFVVSAYNSQGESLPSAIRSVYVLANGTVGDLAQWEFTGLVGNGDAAPQTATPRITAGQVQVSALSRGAGLVAASGWVTQFFPDRFSSIGVNGVGNGATIAEAIARNQFTQFTVTSRAGYMLSITGLSFQAWFKTTSGVSAALQYSVDGITFTTVTATGVPNSESGYTVNLESVAGLKNVRATVTFRIVLAGIGFYDSYGIGLGTPGNDLVLRGRSDVLPAA